MPIKLIDQFQGFPQFLVFENPADQEDFVTVQLSVRLTDEEAKDLSRLIDLTAIAPGHRVCCL